MAATVPASSLGFLPDLDRQLARHTRHARPAPRPALGDALAADKSLGGQPFGEVLSAQTGLLRHGRGRVLQVRLGFSRFQPDPHVSPAKPLVDPKGLAVSDVGADELLFQRRRRGPLCHRLGEVAAAAAMSLRLVLLAAGPHEECRLRASSRQASRRLGQVQTEALAELAVREERRFLALVLVLDL